MADEKEKVKVKKKGGLIGFIVKLLIFIVILLALLLLVGNNFGLNIGGMLGLTGNTQSVSTSTGSSDDSASGEATGNGKLSGTVEIKISEDKVSVGGQEVADKDQLKSVIEQAGSDVIYEISDDNSIKDTYDWVNEALNETGANIKQ